MACFHPLWACYQDDPRRPVKILGSDEPAVKVGSKYDIPGFGVVKAWPVPCGQCIGCRLDYSRDWADRCVIEAKSYPDDHCWFVTLTYDDDHLPPVGPLNPDFVDVPQYPGTLVPKDLQDWLKRLRIDAYRDRCETNIRFYGAGEYGSKSLRPHYHVILYGITFPDLQLYKRNVQGDPLYTSKWLSGTWQNGFAVVAPLSWRTAAYTARYVVKKLRGEAGTECYDGFGVKPEFVRMSLKPGISMPWLLDHFDDVYASDSIVLPPIDGHSQVCKPPRILDQVLKERNPDLYQSIKDARSDIAIRRRDAMLSNLTWLDEEQYLCLSEDRAKKNAYERLKRIDI